MQNQIELRRPAAWYSLLWKDFQLIKSTILAVSIGLLVVQLLFVAIALLTKDNLLRRGMLEGLAFVPCIAPMLLAVGCSGMLIGQERQSGTWGWSSSLPVGWRSSLVSKLCVTMLAIVAVASLLGLAPLVLVLMRKLVISNPWEIAGYTALITSVVMVEIVVYFYLASLLIRETLTALVVAGLVLTVGQMLVILLATAVGSASFIPLFLERSGLSREAALWLASWGWTTSVIVAGSAAMVFAYRQRWLHDPSGLWWFSGQSAAADLPRASNFSYSSVVAPSEWRMLVRHAFANSWPMRLVASLIPLLFAWTDPTALYVVTPFAIGLMGLSAFEGDQSQQRIRFLSDRGVEPMKLITSRLFVAGLWSVATIVMLLALIAFGPYPEMLFSGLDIFGRRLGSIHLGNLAGATSCAFLLGALAAMCFKKPVIAATTAIVTTIMAIWFGLALITVLLADRRWEDVQPYLESSAGYYWVAAIPTALVLLAAIFALAKHWLVRQEDRLPMHYAWVCFLAWAIPVFSLAGAIVAGLFTATLD